MATHKWLSRLLGFRAPGDHPSVRATSSMADERLRRLFVAFVPLFPDASWCGCHGDLVFSTLTVLRP